MQPGAHGDPHLREAVAPIVAQLRDHPFLMELWRDREVVLFGNRIAMTHLFYTVMGGEMWVDYVGPGLFEAWASERGEVRRLWRTSSFEAMIAKLARSSYTARVTI